MAERRLQLVVVTPEKTLLDEPADSLRFPLFDGQIGIFPSRAPMVGRLGFGELVIRSGGSDRSYYIDGGFVQVRDNVVSLLTNDATPVEKLDAASLKTELSDLGQQVAKSDDEYAEKSGRQERLRKMIALVQGS